jgi:hypothetical protein
LNKKSKSLTLFDRFSLAFLNALVALPTGVLLWALLNGYPWIITPWLPAVSILWFTIAMAILGAVTNNTLLIDMYGKIWHFFIRWFSS